MSKVTLAELLLGLRNLNYYLSTDFTELKQITHYYARVSHPGCFLFRTQNPQKTQKANCYALARPPELLRLLVD